MGEIADALRRASGLQPLGSSREAARGASSPAPTPEGPLRPGGRDVGPRVVEPAPPAPQIDRPTPSDPAISLEEGPALEACRQIALAVRGQMEARGARSLAVVSALRDEGKTTTSCNLALALASLAPGREVALIDLDLRRPSVAQVLSLERPKGIEDVLACEASLDEARIGFGQPPLDVYPAMRSQRGAHEVLTRSRLGELFSELERRYSIIILDTPPTLLVPDARLILERAALCLPVARAGVSRVRAFRALLDALPRDQVLSTLLNGVKPNPQYYQGYDYNDRSDPSTRRRGWRWHGRD